MPERCPTAVRPLVLALLVVAAPTHAEDTPRPARVQARLAGTTAVLTVRFEIRLAAHHFPAGSLQVPLPHHAVVTGATVIAEGVAHPLALVPHAQADQEIENVRTGKGAAPAWAALVSQVGSQPQVDIFAPHAGRAIVEVELEAPTCFYRDARFVGVPEAWSRDRGAPGLAAACGEAEAWLRFGGYELSKKPDGDARIVTQVDRLHVAGADFARLELDAARALGDVPADLHTAFVIDGSRSLDPDQRVAQRAIIASYLEHAPGTQAQVIAYARTARALAPAWSTSEVLAGRLARELAAVHPRNGSNVDAGLAEAGVWLSRTAGTRRVVVFSDERLADRFEAMTPAALARLVPPGTLIHVVALTSTGELARDDDAKLAPVAAATGGILVRGGLGEQAVDATQLVRPIAIDHVSVRSRDWKRMNMDGYVPCDGRVAEGTTCTWWGEGSAASTGVEIEGRVWNKPLDRVVTPDPARGRAVARELSAIGDLDEKLLAQVDREAYAVNSVWSLVARWGGTRGYQNDEEEIGGLMGNICGCDMVDDVGMTVGNGSVAPPLDVKPQLASAIAACHPGSAHVDLAIELTGEEIVDVTVDGATGALRDCLTEAVWNTELRLDTPPAHAVTHVIF